MVTEVMVLLAEGREQELEVLQRLHQYACVGVKEAECEPLEDQVQTADCRLLLLF